MLCWIGFRLALKMTSTQHSSFGLWVFISSSRLLYMLYDIPLYESSKFYFSIHTVMNIWSCFHLFSNYYTNNATLKTVVRVFLYIIPQGCDDKISPNYQKKFMSVIQLNTQLTLMFYCQISTPNILRDLKYHSPTIFPLNKFSELPCLQVFMVDLFSSHVCSVFSFKICFLRVYTFPIRCITKKFLNPCVCI